MNPVLPASLVAASAAILLLLGCAHLLYTFRGPKLLPRDPELRRQMESDSPGITRETTMWKAWVGFNASHSAGAMLFGLIYGYLALAQADLFFRSAFLMATGLAFLAGWVFLGKRYWFSVPFRSLVVALALYLAGVALGY